MTDVEALGVADQAASKRGPFTNGTAPGMRNALHDVVRAVPASGVFANPAEGNIDRLNATSAADAKERANIFNLQIESGQQLDQTTLIRSPQPSHISQSFGLSRAS